MAKVIRYCERYPAFSEQYMAADEHWHQVCLFESVRLNLSDYYSVMYAIPNGGHRNRVEAANLKMEGVKAGVPDIFLAYPKCHGDNDLYAGLYIEMKRPTGSYGVSDKQRDMMQSLRDKGFATAVCCGWMPALGAVLYYAGLKTKEEAEKVYRTDLSLFGGGIN